MPICLPLHKMLQSISITKFIGPLVVEFQMQDILVKYILKRPQDTFQVCTRSQVVFQIQIAMEN